MKIKVLSLYTKIISFFLVLLGYQSCDIIDPKAEYGSPSAKYRVIGSVVSEDDNSKIKGIRAVLVQKYEDEENPYAADTVFTNNSGEFDLNIHHIGSKYVLKLQDTDGEKNGSFADKELEIDFKDAKYEGGSGWYEGQATKDVGQIQLKPLEKE